MNEAGLKPRVSVRVTYDEARGGELAAAAGPSEPASQAGRVRLVLGAFLCCLSLLTLRLAYVSFGMSEEMGVLRAQAEEAERPEIVDRYGRALALNRDVHGLAVDGRDVWDAGETAAQIVRLFPQVDGERLEARLSERRYTHLLNDIPDEAREALVRSGLPGLRFPRASERAYPQGQLAAHVLGYTIAGRGGATGVERALDERREDGPVRLTLDAGVQRVLEDELAGAMETFSAKAAWGVLMDARDGSVVALASLPTYDPNRPGEAEAAARRNRAASDAYELGSAFKPLTVAAAMEAGLLEDGERFDVSEPIRVGSWSVKDYSPKPHPLTASEVLQYSSNIGTIQIVQRLGAEGFDAALDGYGLKRALKTDLPERRSPLLPARWNEAELATASYGHGIAVSPLALTAAFASMVNGGTYHTPRFLVDTAPDARPVLSERTSATMRLYMRRVLTDGTGRNAEARGYHAVGKTSTADKPDVAGYDEGRRLSSFIGAFPGYDPAYVLLVSLDEPKGIAETYGFATAGDTAAPVFRRVIERSAPMLGLMPVSDEMAFDAFVGLKKGQAAKDEAVPELDALAALLSEAQL